MLEIRQATLSDAEHIRAIYNYYIVNTCYTFEEQPWEPKDAQHKLEAAAQGGYPFWVAYEGDKLVGYCYLSSWNFRSAYRTTAENTIYLAPDELRKGYGRVLTQHLLDQLDRTRFHTLIACITQPNVPSVEMHKQFGFKQVSALHEVGFKHGEWRSVEHWQLML